MICGGLSSALHSFSFTLLSHSFTVGQDSPSSDLSVAEQLLGGNKGVIHILVMCYPVVVIVMHRQPVHARSRTQGNIYFLNTVALKKKAVWKCGQLLTMMHSNLYS